MAKRRREKMSEGKKNIIASLIQEYDIKTAEDIQEALKDLLGGTIQEMMEAELDEHLGYEEYERSDNTDYRNGVKHKTLRSSYGEIPIDVPQDRDGDFEPQIVQKRKKDISAIEQKIIAMSAKGMTTRQISDIVEDIYGFEVSESMVTAVTNKILPQIEEWQQRPLSAVYPIVFIEAIHFSVRDEHIVKKVAAYIILGINDEGKKEVLSITVGENESAKYWLGVLNDLKNRGVQDILILCADGLSGIKESIAAAYPNTEYQRCIVHQVRNTLRYVAEKDKKAFANDLKSIYHAPNEAIVIVESFIGDILTEVQNGLGYADARAKSNRIFFDAWLSGQTNGYSYGELVDIANAEIWQYRDMYLRPDFYTNNLERVRVIIAPVIEDYKSGKIIYADAEFDARTRIYQYVKPDFNPDVEYIKDPLSRDIPSVDNSLFIIARKLLLDSKF